MESVLGIIFSAENVRMLVLLAFGTCGFMWIQTSFVRKLYEVEKTLDKKIDGVESSLNAKISGVESSLNAKITGLEASLLKAMDEKIESFHTKLKNNDFAHLNATIEALTFTLEKNKFLSSEDKAYIDGRLDR